MRSRVPSQHLRRRVDLDAQTLDGVHAELVAQGAVPKLLAVRLGDYRARDGSKIAAEATLENSPSVLFDAVVVPDGESVITDLMQDARVIDFVKDQARHGKTILSLGAGSTLLDACGVSETLPTGAADPGIIIGETSDLAAALQEFIAALAQHRHPARDSDPPRV